MRGWGFIVLFLIGVQASGDEVRRVFENEDKLTMPYTLVVPDPLDSKNEYPLIICLHGAGERGTDNSDQTLRAFRVFSSAKVQDHYPAFVLVPQCPQKEQWVDVPWRDGSYDLSRTPCSDELQMVLEILDTVRGEYNIDSSRIYIAGLSMGGFGTWDLILRNPGMFAAAIPICGGGDPGEAALLRGLPIWIFHGGADPTVPVQGSREMCEALKKAGNNTVRYTEYPGVGHGSWNNALAEEELVPWLFSQQNLNRD